MNWYARYYGDYMRDTAHLSLAEHGAYTVLLDHYYATGAPLSAGEVEAYRICRAFSEDEQAAVRKVLRVFFPLGGDDLRHNSRADRELAKESAISRARSKAGVAGAMATWQGKRQGKCQGNEMANDTTSTTTSTEEQPQPPAECREPARPARRQDKIAWSCDGGWQGITDADRESWRTAYPACDLDQQLERASQWLLANPAKARKRAWRRFIVNWLTRSQERGGDARSLPAAGAGTVTRAQRDAQESALDTEQAQKVAEYRTHIAGSGAVLDPDRRRWMSATRDKLGNRAQAVFEVLGLARRGQ